MSEKQLTFAAKHHQLTNINVWTPDSQWLVYDVRPSGASFTGLTIERVRVTDGATEVLYTAGDGAHVGVVTVSPDMPARYAFIHGPEHPDEEWHYDFHHRRGVILCGDEVRNMEACDITAPFTPGALRGGSHVHVFSPDGSRLSYTYNDHVMHAFNPREDLRNIGVAVPLRAVTPAGKHPREFSGDYFCVLVSHTTSSPQPGSDEINRAYEEGWVGSWGYRRKDGSQQRWALAFIGDTLNRQGEKQPEVFIVDLPELLDDYAQEGERPLAGTATALPAPPAGVIQRRLTFSEKGIATQPRHWLRSSPDGSQIAFLMQDAEGIVQLWTVSPCGGDPHPLTQSPHSIQSAFSWHPQGTSLAFVCDNSIMQCDSRSGESIRLTPRTTIPPCPEAVVFSPDGRRIAYMRVVADYHQLFIVEAY